MYRPMYRPSTSLGARPLLLIVAFLAAGCGGDDPATPSTPTTPTPTNVTDTFTGSINPNGAATHSFAVGRSGSLSATLLTVGPGADVAVGLSLGTWNGSACAIVLAQDNALQGASIIGNATSAGNLCVRIYDVGKLTQSASYEVQVVHP